MPGDVKYGLDNLGDRSDLLGLPSHVFLLCRHKSASPTFNSAQLVSGPETSLKSTATQCKQRHANLVPVSMQGLQHPGKDCAAWVWLRQCETCHILALQHTLCKGAALTWWGVLAGSALMSSRSRVFSRFSAASLCPAAAANTCVFTTSHVIQCRFRVKSRNTHCGRFRCKP